MPWFVRPKKKPAAIRHGSFKVDGALMDSYAAMRTHVQPAWSWSRAMMGRNEGGSGKKPLQLVAARHFACRRVACRAMSVARFAGWMFVASPIVTALDLGLRKRITPTPVRLHGESCNLQRVVERRATATFFDMALGLV